jgi:hypothetical protein
MLFSLETDRNFSNVIRNTPTDVGPGIYETTPVMGNRHKMKAPFGTRGSREIFVQPRDTPPPPGEYASKPLSPNVSVRSVFSSESNRTVFPGTPTPGPGSYIGLDDYQKSPPRQIHHKRLATQSLLTGFVGQDVTGYTCDDAGHWVPMKIPKQGKDFLGPGCYNPGNRESEAMITLDRPADRNGLGRLSTNPGPGAYSPVKRKVKLPIQISGAPRDKPPDGGEPAFVEPRMWVTRSAESSSAFRARDTRFGFLRCEETPSPVAYFRAKRAKFSAGDGFGYRAERNFGTPLHDDPGPGAYEGSPKERKGRSALPRAEDKTEHPLGWVPGPGAYNIGLTEVAPQPRAASVFSSITKRELPRPPATPPPGGYDPKIIDPVGRVPTLIHESRFPSRGGWVDRSKIDNPAPDAYQSIKIKPGRGMTISKIDRSSIDKDKFPGPGTYEVLHKSLRTPCHNARAPLAPPDK